MKSSSVVTSINLQAQPGEVHIIRLSINNRLIIPAVIHIKMDDWVNNKGQIMQPEFSVSPAYHFISPKGNGKITLTIKIPSHANTGDILQSALRIPGLEEQRIPLIVSVKKGSRTSKAIKETEISINLPSKQHKEKSSETNTLLQTQSTLRLLSNMAALEIIPGKWLVSELIINVCTRGMQEAETTKGAEWLKKMSLTRFYKNGCMVFRGAQLPQWIIIASGISTGISSVTGNNGLSMMHTWEQLLLNFIDADIEAPDFKQKNIAGHRDNNDLLLHECGTEPEKWFSYFILGLAQISPRFKHITDQVLEKAKEYKQAAAKNRKAKDVINEKGSLQK